MKKKENNDIKNYKRVEWSENDDERADDKECKDNDENNDLSYKVCDHRPLVYHTKYTERKKRMWSQDKEDNLEVFLKTCDRFKVSETAASYLFNLSSKKVKLNQGQVNTKKN